MPTFDDIFGQDAAIDLLSRAYRADRLPHGLIFAGPIGVGKATTARALGQLFLCEKPKDVTPCGKCDSCRLVIAETKGVPNHPDFHVVYRQLIRLTKEESKARDLSIDVVRDFLIKPADRTSAMNRGKVFVVEEAELMNSHAQNSLLKTLEEPAGRTLIVLLTDQPSALLPTVRSRCQLVRFSPLDETVVRQQLAKRGIAKDVAERAADLSEGSLGVALKWIEDGVVDAAHELAQRLDAMIAGRPVEDLPDWLAKAAEAYAAKQLERDELTSKVQASREGLGVYFKLAAAHARRKLATTRDGDALESLCEAIDAITQAEMYIDSNVTVALALQQLALALRDVLGAVASR